MTLLLGLVCMAAGLVLVLAGRRRYPVAAYLVEVGLAEMPPTRPLDGLRRRVAPLVPSAYVDRLAGRLETAGRGRALAAEEVATLQVVLGLAGLALALVFVAAARPSAGMSTVLMLLLPGCGVLGPKAWVEQAARERQGLVRRDLPDVLDLLAISVEAGLGFDGALDLAARNCDGPLADEIRRALREMELGTSRHDALHAMKRRVDVPELSNFVLALTQADVLGMPIGRVLHAQAHELRARRRQWAREKAGKMPIKILFPLVGFIFPPILVVLLGPAAISIMDALR
ncbi:MAG TPA: type II secretion system F family protein [Acidimicrobiales bacterium]|jgi:tight adherence protein C|nr:type II secretion system F family protein [Acidimicrobiales bacterium]